MGNKGERLGGCAATAALLVALALLYYLLVASLTWVACAAFGLEFNWLEPLGVCAVIALLGLAFGGKGA